MGISQPVSIVGISRSNSYNPESEFYILDFDGNTILDFEFNEILEFDGE